MSIEMSIFCAHSKFNVFFFIAFFSNWAFKKSLFLGNCNNLHGGVPQNIIITAAKQVG